MKLEKGRIYKNIHTRTNLICQIGFLGFRRRAVYYVYTNVHPAAEHSPMLCRRTFSSTVMTTGRYERQSTPVRQWREGCRFNSYALSPGFISIPRIVLGVLSSPDHCSHSNYYCRLLFVLLPITSLPLSSYYSLSLVYFKLQLFNTVASFRSAP